MLLQSSTRPSITPSLGQHHDIGRRLHDTVKITLKKRAQLTQIDYTHMRLKQLRAAPAAALSFTPSSNDYIIQVIKDT